MELNGTCVAITDGIEYTKKTGEKDKKYYFTIEVKSGDFTNKVAFLVFGQDKFNGMGIQVGGTYNVAFDLSSREWQGKWFTDARAFRVARLDNGAKVAQPTQQAPAQAQQPQSVKPVATETSNISQGVQEDLPF